MDVFYFLLPQPHNPSGVVAPGGALSFSTLPVLLSPHGHETPSVLITQRGANTPIHAVAAATKALLFPKVPSFIWAFGFLSFPSELSAAFKRTLVFHLAFRGVWGGKGFMFWKWKPTPFCFLFLRWIFSDQKLLHLECGKSSRLGLASFLDDKSHARSGSNL